MKLSLHFQWDFLYVNIFECVDFVIGHFQNWEFNACLNFFLDTFFLIN